jgi:hypothetical protein
MELVKMTDLPTIDEEIAARAAARASGAAQERRRLNRIFKHPSAARNDELAQSLAFGTDRTADQIIESLKAAVFVDRTVQ